MKKIAYAVVSAVIALASVSCGEQKSPQNNEVAPIVRDSMTMGQLNIRYVDMDTISTRYNLAKDISESMLRAESKLQSAYASKRSEIEKFASSIEQKGRSNGYLSEESYRADMEKLSKMQSDAEAYMATLQRNAAQEAAQQTAQLQDSVLNFINEYNAIHKYDAILYKAAGIYFNPALDITNEVVEGLNARYNKVKK